jgi:uncharacterized membrane protein (DUF106 family)
MEFGMNNEGYLVLTIIGFSMIVGFILGALSCLYINVKENRELQKEVDKFRDLYFSELDNWRNKYIDDDDYEAY